MTPPAPASNPAAAGNAATSNAVDVWLVHLSSTPPEPHVVARVSSADVSRSSTLTIVVARDDTAIGHVDAASDAGIDSKVQLLEPHDLPPGELAAVGEQHIKAIAVALADLLDKTATTAATVASAASTTTTTASAAAAASAASTTTAAAVASAASTTTTTASAAAAAASTTTAATAARSLPVVIAAVDRVAQLASWEVVQEQDRVVVADSLDAAVRVLAMLRAGADVDEVLHPPGFGVALSLADAGIGRPADSESLVSVEEAPTPPGSESLLPTVGQSPTSPGSESVVTVDDVPVLTSPWLTIRDKDLEVRTQGMGRWATREVVARKGRRRRVVEDAPRRLLLGPANYAGQGGEWARSVREHAPGWTARNMHVVPPHAILMFGADLPLTSVEWAHPATRLDLAIELVIDATDIVVEAMRPLLAVMDGSDAANSWDPRRAREDIDALRATGRNVALLFHGSEVRRPRDHARLTAWSPFYGPQTQVLTANLERTTDLVHEALADFDGPVLVSTPDLLDHVPGAVWLPGVVGPASFLPTTPALTGRRPVVAHAPSSSWLKGSEWVDPVLRRMDKEGLLTYRRLQNLPPIMIPSLLREVDVVVDQVNLSNPGVLAAQAMAAGRLVLAHLTEPVRRRFPDLLPVVETTPETIEQVLLSVIENQEHYSRIAASGIEFSRTYHDGRMSARVLTNALDRKS